MYFFHLCFGVLVWFFSALQQFCLREGEKGVSLDRLMSPELQSSEKCCKFTMLLPVRECYVPGRALYSYYWILVIVIKPCKTY